MLRYFRLNGEAGEGLKPGSYYSITRIWKAGDTIKLNLPMELKWVRSDAPWRTKIHHLPGGEIMHKAVDGDTPPWALTRGPVVYMVDTIWCEKSLVPAGGRIWDDLAVVPDLNKVKLIGKPGELIGPVYEAEFVAGSGEHVRLPMVPFTNLGQWYRPGQPKPERNAAAYSYATWFLDQDAPAFQEKLKESAQLRGIRARSTDYIIYRECRFRAGASALRRGCGRI